MEDLNKFESIGQKQEGCQNGKHLWDEAEGHIGIERDGEFTKIIMRCLACGRKFDISAPFGLNDYINNNESSESGQPQQVPSQTIQNDSRYPNNNEQSDILKRILG